jgi:hypothetical protein
LKKEKGRGIGKNYVMKGERGSERDRSKEINEDNLKI